jgi:hypothetical protein
MATDSAAAPQATLARPSTRARRPERASFSHHVIGLASEEERRLVRVMATTSALNILRRRDSARRVRFHVMELEESDLPAAAVRADKRALSCIPRPDVTFHAAGIWRDPDVAGREGRGDGVAAHRRRSRSLRSNVNARSKISAGSPFGIVWRSRSWTRRSLSWVSREIVSWTL